MLIKPGTKRRRTQVEIEQENEIKEIKIKEAIENKERLDVLEQKMKDHENVVAEKDRYHGVIQGLIDQGVLMVNDDGDIVPNE